MKIPTFISIFLVFICLTMAGCPAAIRITAPAGPGDEGVGPGPIVEKVLLRAEPVASQTIQVGWEEPNLPAELLHWVRLGPEFVDDNVIDTIDLALDNIDKIVEVANTIPGLVKEQGSFDVAAMASLSVKQLGVQELPFQQTHEPVVNRDVYCYQVFGEQAAVTIVDCAIAMGDVNFGASAESLKATFTFQWDSLDLGSSFLMNCQSDDGAIDTSFEFDTLPPSPGLIAQQLTDEDGVNNCSDVTCTLYQINALGQQVLVGQETASPQTEGFLAPNFATDGKLIKDDIEGHFSAVGITPDGLVVASQNVIVPAYRRLIHYNALGNVLGGEVSLSAHFRRVQDLVVDGDLIYVSGENNQMRLCRYEIQPDSSLAIDTSFGNPPGCYYHIDNGTIGNAVTVGPDGKIYVAGMYEDPTSVPPEHSLAIWRLTSSGSLDTTFGTSGMYKYDKAVGDPTKEYFMSAFAITILGDRIYAAGRFDRAAEDSQMALVSVDIDGDASTEILVMDGAVQDGNAGAWDMVATEDGLVVVGFDFSETLPTPVDDMYVWRFDFDSNLIDAFSLDNGGSIDLGYAVSLDCRPDRLYVGGISEMGDQDMAIVRLDSLLLDTIFADNGWFVVEQDGPEDIMYDLAVDQDGLVYGVGTFDAVTPYPTIVKVQ